jgi:15-cis-phytoene synthase
MQLTNIARDVGEDARNGRVYLPLAWLDEAGIDVTRFLERPTFSEALGRVIERLLRHADGLYMRADAGIAMLPRDCQASIHAARLIYSDIGRFVEMANFDSVSRRAYVPLGRKLRLLLRAIWSPTPKMLPGREIAEAEPLDEVCFLVEACRS